MSFSAKVKKELCNIVNEPRHCNIAEIAGIINTCGEIQVNNSFLIVKIQTENPVVAKKYFTLIKNTFGFNSTVSIKKSKQFKKNRVYTVSVDNKRQCTRLLCAIGIIEGVTLDNPNAYNIKKRLDSTVVKSECCKRAYIRGVFISGASLSDPEKSYHMEFINTDIKLSNGLMDIINFFGLKAKIIFRKGYYVVYLKEGECIVDLLNIMGAHISLMDLENVRIIKDMRNAVNRIVNCETANLGKTICASVNQVADIEYIYEKNGLNFLPEQLAQVAHLRLQYPEASIKEIGEMLSPCVGKSGVNHRLRKISSIAENLRGG